MVVRIVLLLFFGWLFLVPSAGAECLPYSDWVPGLYGGGFQLDCQVCDVHMDCTVSYHNFSGVEGVVANGNASFQITLLGDWLDLTVTGGPVYYQVDGENYEVLFDNLYFGIDLYNNGFEIVDVGGGLTVNGEYLPADPILADFLF